MKGDPLPEPDHVLRYVRPAHLDNGAPTGSAFYSRPIDENKPSYNWMECFAGECEEQVAQIRGRQRLKPAKTAVLARLNIGTVINALKEAFPKDCKSEFVYDPLEADEKFQFDDISHSLMTSMPAEGEPLVEAMGDVIAECVIEQFPACQIAE